jgi:hypothetical protein
MSDQDRNRKATVKLDAETARRFESLLREGLVESTAVDREENFDLKGGASEEVEIDAATVARMTEALRAGLFNSGGISADEKQALDALTNRVTK